MDVVRQQVHTFYALRYVQVYIQVAVTDCHVVPLFSFRDTRTSLGLPKKFLTRVQLELK